MYEVRVESTFCAAHRLRMHDGVVEPLHGHDWKVEAIFRGDALDGADVLVDFVVVEQALQRVVAPLHHTVLNDLKSFAGMNPSAELVARHICERLQTELGAEVPLAAVFVREAPGCVAGYLVSPPADAE